MTAAEDRATRNAKAAELHLAGITTGKIAEQLGITPVVAKKAVAAGLAERAGTADASEEVLTEIARIDAMIAGQWARARRGDKDAVDRVLKLGERREKLARPRRNEHQLRGGIDRTIESSKVLIPTLDAGLIDSTRTLADHIDHVLANGTDLEVTKALYLMPHLKNYLESMLATPAARQAAGITAQDAGKGRLAHLRSVANQARNGTDYRDLTVEVTGFAGSP
jgi:hypothetical protein